MADGNREDDKAEASKQGERSLRATDSAAAPSHAVPHRTRNWTEHATLGVLTLTLLAAGYAAYEGSVLSGATTDLVKTQAANSHREVRAYVGVLPGSVENFGDGQGQRFTLNRVNYGRSPAYSVVVRSTLAGVVRTGDPIPEAENEAVSAPGLLTLFPGISLPFPVIGAGNASPEQVQQVREGKDLSFVYAGIVTYFDAYGEEHYTRFCWLFRGKAMTDRDAEWCPVHNDAD